MKSMIGMAAMMTPSLCAILTFKNVKNENNSNSRRYD